MFAGAGLRSQVVIWRLTGAFPKAMGMMGAFSPVDQLSGSSAGEDEAL